MSYSTLEEAEIPKDFLIKYKLNDSESKSFLINEFKKIGLSDPFPDDHITITGSFNDSDKLDLPSKIDDIVYPPQRYVQ